MGNAWKSSTLVVKLLRLSAQRLLRKAGCPFLEVLGTSRGSCENSGKCMCYTEDSFVNSITRNKREEGRWLNPRRFTAQSDLEGVIGGLKCSKSLQKTPWRRVCGLLACQLEKYLMWTSTACSHVLYSPFDRVFRFFLAGACWSLFMQVRKPPIVKGKIAPLSYIW